MKVTIVNTSSRLEKACTFVDFGVKGAWAEVRYPGAAGLYAFSLVHGGMECKRDEHPLWKLSKDSLSALRVLADKKKINYAPKRVGKLVRPRSKARKQQQLELFGK